MRIAIDAHMIGERETGNETYTLNLIRGLLSHDEKNEYFLYTTHADELQARLPCERARIVSLWPAISLLRISLAMPVIARKQGVSLLHVSYIAPLYCPCPTVVTVHDLAYILFPHFFSLRDRLLLSTLVPISLRRAAKVIAVSQRTKEDLMAHYHLPENKVAVTYEAASEAFRPIEQQAELTEVRERYGLHEPFILTIGNLQPRKNMIHLVKAYASLHRKGFAHQLVIAGQAYWRTSDIYRAVKEWGLEDKVLFTGYVPDADLPLLYNAADLFAFVSLYEGFGLPVLEAMACGTPVVSSRAGSLPEVVGDAGLLVDPLDVEDIAQAMAEVLSRPEFASQLRERGLKQAANFSWRRTAEETLRVYEEVVQDSGA
jgi:glycosyltransferase involved in cell wall biosynthesis